jgi:methylglutaconyl-CoA hydratase
MHEFIHAQTTGAVHRIALNRPDKRNSLHAGMVRELHEAVHDASCNPDLRVIVLTGEGSAFCAGADLAWLEQINRNSTLENRDDSQRLMELLLTLRTCSLPIIARVNGHAIAGGCGLALACDIVLAADHALFGFPEVRIGFVPAIVATLLTERVGPGRTRELLIRGNLLTAQQAWQTGMINHVTPAEKLDELTDSIATEIATETSPQAVAMTRRLLLDIAHRDLEDAMRFGADSNALSRETDDFRSGINAFLRKTGIQW